MKRYGGVMTIRVPPGQRHIAATWKADNLWVENYDPETNRCVFSEYSKGNLLQGRVVCGVCGTRMTVRYHVRQGKASPDYATCSPAPFAASIPPRC